MKDNQIILTPDNANQLRKDFTVTKEYLHHPQIMTSISDESMTIGTIGIFSFLSFFITFFLIAETIRSFNGTS